MVEPVKEGIAIVIPNWNGKKMLHICLESLYRQSCNDFDIIVVDNGSEDGSADFVQNSHPDVHLIRLSRNEGFSAAVNRGITHARRAWILLLNNDIEVEIDCLERLMDWCDSTDQFDMAALKMLAYADRTVLDGAGDAILRGGVGYRLGTMEKDSASYSLRREVFGACAGAALYRRSLFERIGLFDEDFFAYLEDVDLNIRAVRAGARCMYLPEAVVYHVGSGSTGSKINPVTVRLSTRNNLCIIFKQYSGLMLLRFFPALIVYQFFWLLFVIKKKQLTAYISGAVSGVATAGKMRRKFGQIKETSLMTDRELAERIVNAERQAIDSIMSRRAQQGKNNVIFTLYRQLFC